MIPAAFEYHRPTDVSSVISLLQTHGDEARVLAGGHSLIPMMKLRMAQVSQLIDLQDVSGLDGIAVADGHVTLGAMVTQHQLIQDASLAASVPLIREAALEIADPQVRYMGTVGGNLANGDPGNDMPGIMQCLGATLTLVGPAGERDVRAREYYEAAYMTARQDDEVLTAVRFDVPVGGAAYVKQKRKIGDYATAAAAVILQREGETVSAASIAMTNLSDVPVWSEAAGQALVGSACDADAVTAACQAMLADIDPVETNHGPVEFKRHAASTVLSRAIARAWDRA
ncbi:MAG: xanthine dehydrogenase family protein subunit M [Pseudomonadota bacterium]